MKILFLLFLSFTFLQGQEVSLMSYNLKNFLGQKAYKNGEFSGIRYKPEEQISALIDIIVEAKPDLLGICEIGTEKDLEKFHSLLKEKGVEYPYIEHVNAADSVRHLALLSKYPLESKSYTNLVYKIGAKTFPLRRGLLHVEVTIGNQTVHALGVHLKSKRPVEYADQAIMRLKEAHLVRDQMDLILKSSPDAKVILYGDMNDTFKSPTLGALKGHHRSKVRMEPLDLKAPDGTYWTHFWSYERVYSTFDYVLCSRAFKESINYSKSEILSSQKTLSASDHRPIMVYFNLEND